MGAPLGAWGCLLTHPTPLPVPTIAGSFLQVLFIAGLWVPSEIPLNRVRVLGAHLLGSQADQNVSLAHGACDDSSVSCSPARVVWTIPAALKAAVAS